MQLALLLCYILWHAARCATHPHTTRRACAPCHWTGPSRFKVLPIFSGIATACTACPYVCVL